MSGKLQLWDDNKIAANSVALIHAFDDLDSALEVKDAGVRAESVALARKTIVELSGEQAGQLGGIVSTLREVKNRLAMEKYYKKLSYSQGHEQGQYDLYLMLVSRIARRHDISETAARAMLDEMLEQEADDAAVVLADVLAG